MNERSKKYHDELEEEAEKIIEKAEEKRKRREIELRDLRDEALSCDIENVQNEDEKTDGDEEDDTENDSRGIRKTNETEQKEDPIDSFNKLFSDGKYDLAVVICVHERKKERQAGNREKEILYMLLRADCLFSSKQTLLAQIEKLTISLSVYCNKTKIDSSTSKKKSLNSRGAQQKYLNHVQKECNLIMEECIDYQNEVVQLLDDLSTPPEGYQTEYLSQLDTLNDDSEVANAVAYLPQVIKRLKEEGKELIDEFHKYISLAEEQAQAIVSSIRASGRLLNRSSRLSINNRRRKRKQRQNKIEVVPLDRKSLEKSKEAQEKISAKLVELGLSEEDKVPSHDEKKQVFAQRKMQQANPQLQQANPQRQKKQQPMRQLMSPPQLMPRGPQFVYAGSPPCHVPAA